MGIFDVPFPGASALGRNVITAVTQAAARNATGSVTVVTFTGTSWPTRPADSGPVIFVGGLSPGNEPPGVNGDVWIPSSEDGTVSAAWSGITGKPPSLELIPTAVKNAAYTAAVSDLVPVDTTSAAVTITLPTAPLDRTRIAVKAVAGTVAANGSLANKVTVAAGGTDVFNKTGGSTTLTLSALYQSVVMQYLASSHIWYVVSTDAPLSAIAPSLGDKLLAPPSYLSGYYYYAAPTQLLATSATLGNQNIRVGAWLVTQQVSISRFNAEVTVAGETGSVFRIGVWASDGPGGQPDSLVCDAGTIPGDGAVGVKEAILGSPLILQPGLYYVGGAVQNAATTPPTMRVVQIPFGPGGPLSTTLPAAGYAMCGYIKTGVTGAFGAFSGAGFSGSTSGIPARIGFKVS